jgi:hypothetical protein
VSTMRSDPPGMDAEARRAIRVAPRRLQTADTLGGSIDDVTTLARSPACDVGRVPRVCLLLLRILHRVRCRLFQLAGQGFEFLSVGFSAVK